MLTERVLLTRRGARPYRETGTEALSLARGRPLDLVVLDVMLPDTDGFGVVRRL
jgi:DNA-binding response OmpR family regulator